MISAINLISEYFNEQIEISSSFQNMLFSIFKQFTDKRKKHLNDVTMLAWHLMKLRKEIDQTYIPNQDLFDRKISILLLAFNFHDIGDLISFIPDIYQKNSIIKKRKEEIQKGDWISSTSYSEEKFFAPVKGRAICQTIIKGLYTPSELTDDENKIIESCHLKNYLNISKDHVAHPLLNAIDDVAYHHHEAYNGKGWPEGIHLDPENIFYDITFFDFIAGWFSDKTIRGDQTKFIPASTPDIVLEAIHKREKINRQKYPGLGSMYHPGWTDFFEKHLDEIIQIVAGIFPDVQKQVGG